MTKNEAGKVQERALAALRKEFGDKVLPERGTIDGPNLTLKFKFLGDDKAVADKLRGDFILIAHQVGLQESDFDLPLTLSGKPCTLVEVNFRRGKYPFVVRMSDSGTRFKVTADIFKVARVNAAAKKAA